MYCVKSWLKFRMKSRICNCVICNFTWQSVGKEIGVVQCLHFHSLLAPSIAEGLVFNFLELFVNIYDAPEGLIYIKGTRNRKFELFVRVKSRNHVYCLKYGKQATTFCIFRFGGLIRKGIFCRFPVKITWKWYLACHSLDLSTYHTSHTRDR